MLKNFFLDWKGKLLLICLLGIGGSVLYFSDTQISNAQAMGGGGYSCPPPTVGWNGTCICPVGADAALQKRCDQALQGNKTIDAPTKRIPITSIAPTLKSQWSYNVSFDANDFKAAPTDAHGNPYGSSRIPSLSNVIDFKNLTIGIVVGVKF